MALFDQYIPIADKVFGQAKEIASAASGIQQAVAPSTAAQQNSDLPQYTQASAPTPKAAGGDAPGPGDKTIAGFHAREVFLAVGIIALAIIFAAKEK